MTWQPDGWDVTTRLGVLVPHADVGPETELRAMAPRNVAIHASRMLFTAMRAGGEMDPTIALEPVRALAMPPHVDSAVELLAAAPVQAIGYGFTSSAYLIGPDGEQEMIARLQAKSNGIPVVAACASVIAGLKALGISRIALVSPPWFDATLAAGGARHYQAAGFEVVFSSPCDLPSGQRLIEPQTLYDWTRTHVPDTAEGVVMGGNGFRAIGVIDALEQVLGRPVLTANQALFWGLMKAASADVTQVTRYGRLFAA